MLNIGFRAKHVPLHCNYNNMITNLKKIKIKSLGRGFGKGSGQEHVALCILSTGIYNTELDNPLSGFLFVITSSIIFIFSLRPYLVLQRSYRKSAENYW